MQFSLKLNIDNGLNLQSYNTIYIVVVLIIIVVFY